MQKHLKIVVSGRVQGVFFRKNAQEIAQKNNLVGYAKNIEDGTVMIEVEGDESDLERLVRWCYSGSKYASVEDMKLVYSEVQNDHHGFEIR